MRGNKFEYVKDIIVPVIIALVVVLANDYFLKNQKKRETKMVHEEAILLRQYEILNRILLFCAKYGQGNEVYKLKDFVWKDYIKNNDLHMIKFDSLEKILQKKKLNNFELKKIDIELKELVKTTETLRIKMKFDVNKLSEKEFDSLYYVYSDLPLFLTNKDENRLYRDDILYFKQNIGLIDHRIGLLVLSCILDIPRDFNYTGSFMTSNEGKKSLWSNSKKYKEWKVNLGVLYSVTFEYIYQEKFDGKIPIRKYIKIQDYLDNLQNDFVDSSLIYTISKVSKP